MDISQVFRSLQRAAVPAILVCCVLFGFGASQAFAQTSTTCDAADPFDSADDTDALQDCCDNYDIVLLHSYAEPGYNAYIISDTLWITRNGILITGVDYHQAFIRAADTMPVDRKMVRIGADDFLLAMVEFNGRRENRDEPEGTCAAENVYIADSAGFTIQWVGSYSAPCGSGMTLDGETNDYEIHHSIFYNNGKDAYDGGPWADGLTVNGYACVNGYIHDNELAENTDVSLGVSGHSSCAIYRNTITNFEQYTFAGLVVGDACCAGGDVTGNTVESGYNKMGFGILVGPSPWDWYGWSSDLVVYENSSDGAVVTLAVDRLDGGDVYDNSYSNNQGDRLGTCGSTAAYTVGDLTGGASVQSGSTYRTYSGCAVF